MHSISICQFVLTFTSLNYIALDLGSENDSKASNLLKSYFISTSAFALLCTVPGLTMSRYPCSCSLKVTVINSRNPCEDAEFIQKKCQELYTQKTVSLTFPCWVAGCIWMLYVDEFNAQHLLFLELVCSGWSRNNLPSLNLASLNIILLSSIYPISTCSL